MESKIINLTNKEYMDYLLQYYKLLSDGRVKPDNKGNAGTVRESINECDAMEQVKSKLASIFRLDPEISYKGKSY